MQFREKMFEYYGNKHVYCPGVGADEPVGSIFFFRIINIRSHFLQDFPFKLHFYSLP